MSYCPGQYGEDAMDLRFVLSMWWHVPEGSVRDVPSSKIPVCKSQKGWANSSTLSELSLAKRISDHMTNIYMLRTHHLPNIERREAENRIVPFEYCRLHP